MKLALSLVLPAVLLCLGSTSGATQVKANPEAGKARYDALCASCHGASGKGDGPVAAALNPKPQDHTDGKHMNELTDQFLFDIVKGGGVGVKKSPLMPAFGTQLKDEDVWNLVAYIRSLAQPPYKPPK
jgi:mono/diheme cytochrome c family protein